VRPLESVRWMMREGDKACEPVGTGLDMGLERGQKLVVRAGAGVGGGVGRAAW
jgi:hypothetical protein